MHCVEPCPYALGENGMLDALPPAYTLTAPCTGTNNLATNVNKDRNDLLSACHTIFVVNQYSYLMESSWEEIIDALRLITPICRTHDSAGVNVYFLNDRLPLTSASIYRNITDLEPLQHRLNRILPCNTNPTTDCLQSILQPYINGLVKAKQPETMKPINVIVITNSQPTVDPERNIMQQATLQERIALPLNDIYIRLFFLNHDSCAYKALCEVDTDVADNRVRDVLSSIVSGCKDKDTISDRKLTADDLLRVVLGGMMRELNHKATSTAQLTFKFRNSHGCSVTAVNTPPQLIAKRKFPQRPSF